MNGEYMMLAAIMLNNQNQDRDEYRQNLLSTREMCAVRKPRRSTKQMLQAVLALVTTLKNRLPRRADGLEEQPRIGEKRQASLS